MFATAAPTLTDGTQNAIRDVVTAFTWSALGPPEILLATGLNGPSPETYSITPRPKNHPMRDPAPALDAVAGSRPVLRRISMSERRRRRGKTPGGVDIGDVEERETPATCRRLRSVALICSHSAVYVGYSRMCWNI
jgi:hypothetical protein